MKVGSVALALKLIALKDGLIPSRGVLASEKLLKHCIPYLTLQAY